MRTVRELGLPARAVTALTRAGITDAAALAALTRRELAEVPGVGPGMVAAIRAVVPEPPAVLPRAAAQEPGAGADDDEFPPSPAIPSFDSLRGPRRRSAVDLLLPDAPAPQEPAVPSPPTPVPAPPTIRFPAAAPGPEHAPPPVRPPDYADLLRLGVHVARALAVAPARITVWSVEHLRRLLAG
ncbi:RNA polymerase alpha subunit [Blastococcus xanthinilyticus]|uniref:RNA polymerase alpha subunit n=1 Tax=Blastococcus xanthinilyticus TaxID=1564164 RepID=A0A5S5CZC4_9ACTN|nr:RNA polymerase alpha subunit [Blastococcus xanthinilyticus]